MEIDIDALTQAGAVLEKRFKELPKYPSVTRDISLAVGKDVSNGELVRAARDAGGALLKEIELIDRYAGKQIPDGKVGLTYRLEYYDSKKTLEEKDILEAHTRVVRVLETKFGARLR